MLSLLIICEMCLPIFPAVRGAAILKSTALKEVWNIKAVMPVDRGLKESKSQGKSSGYNEHLPTK